MSAATAPIAYFTLAEAVAWIAFQDSVHALRHSADLTKGAYPVDSTVEVLAAPARIAPSWDQMKALQHPPSEEGRRLWNEAARLDDKVQCATRKLAAALADGSLQARGERLIGGPAGGAAWEPIDCDTEDSIVAKHRPCEIPCEWLHNRGGWLVIRAATEAAREGDRYYCQVRIEAEAVRRMRPNSTIGAPVPADAPPVRRRRSGYEEADKPLVEEMLRLLTSGDVKNPWRAAQAVATRPEAQGSKEGVSTAKRLLDRFNKTHPDFQNCSDLNTSEHS